MDSAISRSCGSSCADTASQQTSPLSPGTGDALLLLQPNSSEMRQGSFLYQFTAAITRQASLERLRLRSCTQPPGWLDLECEIMKGVPAFGTIPLWSSPKAFFRRHPSKFSSATVILRRLI